ncbi:hypothetical protein BDN67DRAFT_1012673 [Paxillus ammoniavirescens]|nr:hypothetical protein BDN67DRAFT_1012673 [Paxillus ammoniavirescens]
MSFSIGITAAGMFIIALFLAIWKRCARIRIPRRPGSGTHAMMTEARSVPLPISPASVPTISLPSRPLTIGVASEIARPQPVATRGSPHLGHPTFPQPDLQDSETIPPPLALRNASEIGSMGSLDDGNAWADEHPNNPMELPPTYEPPR